MADFKGTIRDALGNKLLPKTVAGQVLATAEDGSLQPLDILLADNGIIPAIIKEETRTLQAGLEAGDLYQVIPYAVGQMRIQIWIDGAYAIQGPDGIWEENGEMGATSDTIHILGNIDAGRVITVRVGERVENFAPPSLSDEVDSPNSEVGASSLAVKTAYDEACELDVTVVDAGATVPANLRSSGIYFQKSE